jgi:hypothetical protein
MAQALQQWCEVQERGHLMSDDEYEECARVIEAKDRSHRRYKAWSRHGYIVRYEASIKRHTLLIKVDDSPNKPAKGKPQPQLANIQVKKEDAIEIDDDDDAPSSPASSSPARASPIVKSFKLKKVPRMSEVLDILTTRHDEAGHPGSYGTYTKIAEEFFGIPRILCEAFLKRCLQCLTKQAAVAAKKLPLRAIRSGGCFQRAGIDLFDMQNTPGGPNKDHRYVFHFVDHFTKFSILRALKDKSMDSIYNELHDIFMNFGPPDILQSDNGAEFVNSRVKDLCAKYNVKFIQGRAYHPQTNGLVEKANQFAKKKLSAWIAGRHKDIDWLPGLKEVQFAINTQVRKTIKSSPYKLLFNRSPIADASLVPMPDKMLFLFDSDDEDAAPADQEEHKAAEQEHEERKDNALAATAVYQAGYEHVEGAISYKADDMVTVLIKKPRLAVHSNSLAMPRLLMEVVKVFESNVVQLYCEYGLLKTHKPFADLAPVMECNAPAWAIGSKKILEEQQSHRRDGTLSAFIVTEEEIVSKEQSKFVTARPTEATSAQKLMAFKMEKRLKAQKEKKAKAKAAELLAVKRKKGDDNNPKAAKKSKK